MKILKLAIIAMLVLPFAVRAQPTRVLTIVSEPDAYVWSDDVAYGKTGKDGKIRFRTFAVGTHKLRVRAVGFQEVTRNLLPSQKGEIRVELVKTTDEAELAFQKAEIETAKERSVDLYKMAIRLRPAFPEAYIGLARQQANLGDSEEALKSVRAARRLRPGYALASAVEGRILKDASEFEKAIAAFKRSITEGRGIQPEAHTGLGLLYKDRAESAAAVGRYGRRSRKLSARRRRIAESRTTAIRRPRRDRDLSDARRLLRTRLQVVRRDQGLRRVFGDFPRRE